MKLNEEIDFSEIDKLVADIQGKGGKYTDIDLIFEEKLKKEQ